MLQYGTDTFQAHSGINRRFRQFFPLCRPLNGCTQDDIPGFDMAVAVFFSRTRRATPNVITVIVENFGTRTARTGVAHLPEVIGSVRCAPLLSPILTIRSAGTPICWCQMLYASSSVSYAVTHNFSFSKPNHCGEVKIPTQNEWRHFE